MAVNQTNFYGTSTVLYGDVTTTSAVNGPVGVQINDGVYNITLSSSSGSLPTAYWSGSTTWTGSYGTSYIMKTFVNNILRKTETFILKETIQLLLNSDGSTQTVYKTGNPSLTLTVTTSVTNGVSTVSPGLNVTLTGTDGAHTLSTFIQYRSQTATSATYSVLLSSFSPAITQLGSYTLSAVAVDSTKT